MRVAVVGAGIAGLAQGFRALRLGDEVTVLERAARPGGNIRTVREDGYVVEAGPNGFLDDVPETLDLVRSLGLGPRLAVSSDRARIRFLYRGGRLLRIPETPPAFLASPLLSPAGRARVLLEPFARPRPRGDETVFDFAARRIGREAARVLVQAMVSGVYGGDARALSLRATFPKMYEMEAEHGGLFRAMLARRRGGGGGGGPAGPGGVLTSFRDGMETLTETLARALGDRLRLREAVGEIARDGPGYAVPGVEGRVDRVVLACPAAEAARMLGDLAPEAARALAGIRGAPITVVAAAYDEGEIGGAPPGFGFLVPRGEGPRILGCLWSSSIYPGLRAPEGKVLLRTMIGGALDPGAVDLDGETLLDLAARDLRTTMGLSAAPLRHWIFRFPRGIPQYETGHLRRLAAAVRALAPHPGLVLAGNSYRGISVNAVIRESSIRRRE